MGGKKTRDMNSNDEADIKIIRDAIDLGVTHIDTAEKYAEGYAEILVGKAIQGYDRKDLFLVTKAAETNFAYDDLLNAAKASLQRLHTDYVDLYLLHEPNPNIPIKETMRALDTLADDGLIRSYGVSNFNVREMEEAHSYAKRKIVANQMHLNLKYREAERRGVLEYCQRNDVMFIAWRPLQKGIILDPANTLLSELCQKYGKTPSQIALNWLTSQKNVVTISKTGSLDHLKENLGAFDFTIEEGDIEKLRNDFPDQQPISDAVPLNP